MEETWEENKKGECTCNINGAETDIGHFKGCPALPKDPTGFVERKLEEFEKTFVDRPFEPDGDWVWKRTATPYNISDFICTALEEAESRGADIATQWYRDGKRDERGEVIEIVEGGGTFDTILAIFHNGEKFLNQRQLLKALKKMK